MLDILLATQNLPFTIAITVALLIVVIEIFALLVGAGGLVDGLTADMDVSADIDGFSFLDYLCIGRIPFLIWLVIFPLSFGAVGIIFQSLFGLSPLIAAIIVLVIAVFPTRVISLFVAKIMPKDETTAINSDDWDCLGDGIDKDQIMIVNKHTQANISTERFYGAWKLIETSYGTRWKFELFKSESEAKQAMIEAQEPAND